MTTSPSPQAQATIVKHAVTSIATCSTATVTTLDGLLKTPETCPPAGAKTVSRPKAKPSVSTSKPKLGAPSRKSKPKVSVLEVPAEPLLALSTRDRFILATEVINASLKTLTEAIKSPPPLRRQPSSKKVHQLQRSTSGQKLLSRATTVPEYPLQSRSLNRVSSSPACSPRLSRTSSSSSIDTSGSLPVAECARLAFSCLRSLQATRAAGTDMPPLQLETGMSALVGKLVALGHDDMAVKELRILKKRLDALVAEKKMAKPGKETQPRVLGTGSTKAGLASLLHFDCVDYEAPALSLAIAVQMHVLKLIAASKIPANIDAAFEHLRLSCPSSPVNFLLALSSQSAYSSKALQQLAAISQTLFSLCPSISSSEDHAALNLKVNPCPETAFRLQHLALDIRLLWWKLSGHQGDSQKDILQPFARCLNAFSRRASLDLKEKYEVAARMYQSLADTLDCDGHSTPSTDDLQLSTRSGIFRLLGALAQEASLTDDAIRWTKTALDLHGSRDMSDAGRGAFLVRLVNLMLRTCPSDHLDEQGESLLEQAAACLQGKLRGDSADFDALLMELPGLKRAAISTFSRDPTSDSTLNRLCTSLVFASLRFLNKYLGTAPGVDAGPKDLLQYEQRRRRVEGMAVASVDSALSLAKQGLSNDTIPWNLLDCALRDCVDVASNMANASTKQASGDVTDASFVKASNVYWAYYLRQQKAGGQSDGFQPVHCLWKSIDLARRASPAAAPLALLAVKLDRLGTCHESRGRFHEAYDAYLEAIQTHVSNGVLQEAAAIAAKTPLRDVWETAGAISMLAKSMGSLLRSGIKSRGEGRQKTAFYDDISLDIGTRGIALEWQLELLLAMLEATSDLKKYQTTATALSNVMIDLYNAGDYPIRRMRTFVKLLRLCKDHRSVIADDIADRCTHGALQLLQAEASGCDVGLLQYQDHTRATLSVYLAFQDGDVQVEVLKGSLTTWSDLAGVTGSWETYQERVDDANLHLAQLLSIADFFEMKGLDTYRIATLTLIARIREWQNLVERGPLVETLSALGLQYLRLGYSGKAGLVLARAQNLLVKSVVSAQASLRWHLCYAEYQLSIGNTEECSETLLNAKSISEDDPSFQRNTQPGATVSGRVNACKFLADVYLVCSRLAFENGSPGEALAFAKRCVKLNYRAWAGLESRTGNTSTAHSVDLADSEVDSATEGMSGLTLSTAKAPTVMSTTHEALDGAAFWTLVPSLYRGLHHLSTILSHHGMFQEAIYWTQQASKIVETAKATPLIMHNLTVAGHHWARGGHVEKGAELLTQGKNVCDDIKNKVTVALHSCLGNLHRMRGDAKEELAAYEEAERMLGEITAERFINGLEHMPPLEGLERDMAKLAVGATPVPAEKASSRSRSRPPAKGGRATRDKNPKVEIKSCPSSAECVELHGLRGSVLRLKAVALALQRQSSAAASLLQEAGSCHGDQQSFVQQRICNAKHLMQQSLEEMAADAVFCVLQESTISFPSIAVAGKTHQRLLSDKTLSDKALSAVNRPCPPQKSPLKSNAKKGERSASPARVDFVHTLHLARASVSDVLGVAMRYGSTATVHSISSALSRITMLLSAANPGKDKSLVHPAMAAYSMEIARTLSVHREREAIQVDKHSHGGENRLQWPILSEQCSPTSMVDSVPSDFVQFQRNYIDIIPSEWTAVSISLSESRDELYISKLQAAHGPFILRLPLDRHNSRDADEEVFNFAQVREELHEIIELANFSAHDARDMSRSGAKSQWWAEREALDSRLKDLLLNIENMWLGGFRGVFSDAGRRQDLLSRFQRSFHNILDKYLPSRQKTNKRSKSGRVTLDPRVLELFVGLGDPTDGCDLDEPLTDLLYFVVDILQFHGERNAYDEIDFDSIVVETQDALKSYHEAARAEANLKAGHHTILILDKALHAIPWESLPCLDGKSVSRIPSLGCLRDRILSQQQSLQHAGRAGHHVSRNRGTCVLNPAGDLKSTQAVFDSDFRDLDGWDTIVQCEPLETEIRDALESRDVFVYFGHGSGAQYIRARTIKKLDKCAVALLMGCSSGTLTDAGEFEPYGTPIHYTHAGCPALVATLWDVTDKDIDRFSHALLKRWGLLPTTSTFPSSSTSRAKGKGHERTTKATEASGSDSTGPVSLVEAAARGREACILRYLNGAAPVVYGIPVYLDLPSEHWTGA